MTPSKRKKKSNLKKVKIKHLYKYRFVNKLMASLSGDIALVAAKQADAEENKYFEDLWLLRNGELLKLATKNEIKTYFWDMHDQLLFVDYVSKADKEAQERGDSVFYRWNLDLGLPQRAFSIPLSVAKLEALDDCRYLVLAACNRRQPVDLYSQSPEKRKAFFASQKELAFMTEYQHLPFYFNGQGDVDGCYRRLFIYDEKTDELTALTATELDVEDFTINDKRDAILLWSSERKPCYEFKQSLVRIEVKKDGSLSEPQVLFTPESELVVISAKEDQGEIYVISRINGQYGLNQSAVMRKLVDGQLVDCLSEQFSLGVSVGSDVNGAAENLMWRKAPDEPLLRYLRTERFRTALCTFDGKSVELEYVIDNGALTGFTIVQGQIYVVASTQNKLSEVYSLKIGVEQNNLKQISHFNDNALAGRYVAEPQLIQFESSPLRAEYNSCKQTAVINVEKPEYSSPYLEDNKIDGFVLLPQNFDSRKSYPAILDIHGGPRTVYGDLFFHEMQVWVNQGYVVMFCNPRGGDGRGDGFADIRGKYGFEDYQDIMDFVDRVLELYPNIDQARMGVTGGSYGGFMTNWIVGHTNRFACAATQRSISNWISFYGVSDIGFTFGCDQNFCDTSSEEGWQKMWQHSPLRYVNNVSTPLLLIHSDQDYRCPQEQALQFYTALKHRGVECKLCLYHGENHELSRSGKPKSRISRLEEITDWFKKYLRHKES